MLTIAAVVGREFGLEELVRLIGGASDEWVLEMLEEAVAARVIEEVHPDNRALPVHPCPHPGRAI